jgi:hypothetical protein
MNIKLIGGAEASMLLLPFVVLNSKLNEIMS